MIRHARFALALLSFAPVTALAQDATGFDAHSLQVAALDGDPRDPLLVQRPGRFRGGEFFGGGVFEFAKGLLMQTTKSSDGSVSQAPVLDDLFALNLSVGVAPISRLRFDLAMPIVFLSTGLDGPNGVQVGDLRGTAMIALVRPKPGDVGFGLGLEGHVDAPTGNTDVYLGQRTIAGGTKLATTYAVKRFTLSADAGVQFNPRTVDQNLRGSDAFIGGLGLGVLADDRTGITLEARLSAPFEAAGHPGGELPAEILLHARHRWDNGAYLLGGGGMGVSPGVGAGAFRVFLGVGYGRIKDDGACPDGHETRNGWKDDDGCADELAVLDVTTTWSGQPVGDVSVALADEESNTRTITTALTPVRVEGLMPLSTWHATATGDCLEGSGQVALGGEGSVNTLAIAILPVRDAVVRLRVTDTQHRPIVGATADWKDVARGCVDQTHFLMDATGSGLQNVGQGTHELYVTAAGYELVQRDVVVPRTGEVVVEITLDKPRVRVTTTALEALEDVHFEFDKDVIMADSFPLLNEVVANIRRNNLTVRVGGHTDWIGTEAYNVDLSTRRAASVMSYLQSHGVKAKQLVSSGYGETSPTSTNDTDAGRAQNRRVDFEILSGTPLSTP